jgi:hypothetical protein
MKWGRTRWKRRLGVSTREARYEYKRGGKSDGVKRTVVLDPQHSEPLVVIEDYWS